MVAKIDPLEAAGEAMQEILDLARANPGRFFTLAEMQEIAEKHGAVFTTISEENEENE